MSSARVGAVTVRTGAGLGADVRLAIPAPQNEVQPRPYRIEPTTPFTGLPAGVTLIDDITDKQPGIPDVYTPTNCEIFPP